MCGICGFIARRAEPNGERIVERMIRSIAHRGPDQQSQRGNDRVRLGFARLAIIDLTPAASQPMSDEHGRFEITFNGEVFNYVEIRAQLENLGHEFRTNSDTEVVLRAFIEWGCEAFARFRGMWALCIRDHVTDELVFSRDYFGIKPLYFCELGDRIYWASEIKAFLAAGVSLTENETTAREYLRFGLQDHTPETFFSEVWQLMPGQVAVITRDLNVTRKQYWSLPSSVRQMELPRGERAQIDYFRTILLSTIDISLRSDLPVWVLLSGGLDSSTIVSAIRHLHPEREINAVSAVHSDREINEEEYLDSVVNHTGCNVEKVLIDNDDFIDVLDALFYHQDEPPASTTCVNHWLLMRALNGHGIRVILSGQGIDEIMYGYVPIFMGYLLADLLASARWGAFLRELRSHWLGRRDLFPSSFRREFSARALKGMVPPMWSRRIRESLIDQSRGLVRPPDGRSNSRYHPPTLPDADRLHNAFFRMLSAESIPRILHYEDRGSMAFSIEERVPFLDREIVTFAFATGSEMKVRNGVSKWVLREAMAGILPEQIRSRRSKLGFTTPESSWLRSPEFREYARSMGVSQVLKESIIDSKAFKELERRIWEGNERTGHLDWRVYSYALWRRRFGLW